MVFKGFAKAHNYKGGFEKWVYDTLKEQDEKIKALDDTLEEQDERITALESKGSGNNGETGSENNGEHEP